MATQGDVTRYNNANRDVRALITREVRLLWNSLDVSDAMNVRYALEELLPPLIAAYGEIAATVAADYYDELRIAAGVPSRFSAVLAPSAPPEAVRTNARWAIGPLFSANPNTAQALARVEQEADRMVLQQGKQTISESVKRDPAKPRWARVPKGPTCAWCLVLASAGAVYGSAEAAGKDDPDRYHARCDCEPTPVWAGSSLPEGYDPDALRKQYKDAVEVAGSSDLKSITAALRQAQGIS